MKFKYSLMHLLLAVVLVAFVSMLVSKKIRKDRLFIELSEKYLVASHNGMYSIAARHTTELNEENIQLVLNFAPEISEVNFSTRDLTNCPSNFIKEFRAVEVLVLDNCKLHFTCVENLARLEKLTTLYLRNVCISDYAISSIARNDSIESLFLSDNVFSEDAILDLAQLDKLKVLELKNTKISNVVIEKLKSHLKGCRIIH